MPQFNSVQLRRPSRSSFNLSYEKKFTCDMGQLIPVLCDEMVPGDSFTIGNECVIRFQPLVAPTLHEINQFVHYFFVPYRLLDENWEDFITGGPDGKSDEGDDAIVLPRWLPDVADTAVGSLWDFLGFPVGVVPTGSCPLDYPRRAYNFVWNEFYRDQNLQEECLLTNALILNRGWQKDYFTSALPWQQRGTAPALPISGTSKAVFQSALPREDNNLDVDAKFQKNYDFGPIDNASYGVSGGFKIALDNNIVDLNSLSTFDVADLRLAFQIQRWMERNALGGARYTEFLTAHFGISPRDERLQRPEFIGGTKTPILISEVLQTSATSTTPQGNLAGHAISASRNFAGKYTAREFGLVIGFMSVMPKPSYSQGINRQWLRETRYDFYFPSFANLSEQAVEQAEIFATGVELENKTIFGYQGRYNEMRYKPNQICSEMRSLFEYWHLGRKFATAPLLNEEFVECKPDALKRIFAVPGKPGLIVNFANVIKAIRPLPVFPEPGRIDH